MAIEELLGVLLEILRALGPIGLTDVSFDHKTLMRLRRITRGHGRGIGGTVDGTHYANEYR